MAFLQVNIEQAVFTEDFSRYYLTITKQVNGEYCGAKHQTNVSGETKTPIFD